MSKIIKAKEDGIGKKIKENGGPFHINYPQHISGKRDDLDGQYFRSSWESNFARYLNWLQENKEIDRWEYESERFEFKGIKRGSQSYLIDFKVYENNGTVKYYEIKGWMDQKSKTKLKRMAKYYPDIKIIIIEKKQYMEIGRKVSGMIKGWEFQKNRTW